MSKRKTNSKPNTKTKPSPSKGGAKAETSKPAPAEEDALLPFRPFHDAPARPADLWRRWAELMDNIDRTAALVAYGRSLLGEMLDAVVRWGDVAVMLDLEGVDDDDDEWQEALGAIDAAMATARDSIIHAKSIGPRDATGGDADERA